jgi:hypothetical protein
MNLDEKKWKKELAQSQGLGLEHGKHNKTNG